MKCVGFDHPNDIDGGYGSNSGIYSGATTPTLDTSTRASGASALRFTIPTNSGSDTSGSYFTNFSNDLSVQFGENQDFYVQWRQRFSPEFISTMYQGGGGWKQNIIGTGDQPGQLYHSCTALEVVTQNTYQRGFAQMYNSCTGSTSHGAYNGFEEPFGGSDFKLQNNRPSPYCLYSQSGAGRFPPAGNCFGYFANEWMTFQVHIRTGPRVNDEFTNSHVDLWIAREGQPSEHVLNWGPYNLTAGAASANQRFGKVWLLPYHTGKSSAHAHPTAYTWYDELIISRQRVADPSVSSGAGGGSAGTGGGVSGTGGGSSGTGGGASGTGGGSSATGGGVSGTGGGVSGTGGGTTSLDGGSALATLAASMAPGTWAQLTVPGQDAVMGIGSISGTMLHYSNSMPWNAHTRVVEIVGMDHGYASLRHVQYVEATNRFVLVADNAGLGTGHGYDHQAVNPFTGDLYSRLYGGFSGTIRSMRRSLGAPSFTAIPNVSGTEQVAIGATWWSGSFMGAGAQGAFVIFNSGSATNSANDGQIVAFDPLANSWFFNRSGLAPNYGSGATYHSLIEYSRQRNVAVFGGGNVARSKLWRLNADGSSTRLTDVPSGKGVGVQGGLLVDEPRTGNFLLLSAGELWELDPTGSGTWTQQTGARAPPSGVGNPSAPALDAMVVSAIPDYGVIMYIKQPRQTGGTVYLYKH